MDFTISPSIGTHCYTVSSFLERNHSFVCSLCWSCLFFSVLFHHVVIILQCSFFLYSTRYQLWHSSFFSSHQVSINTDAIWNWFLSSCSAFTPPGTHYSTALCYYYTRYPIPLGWQMQHGVKHFPHLYCINIWVVSSQLDCDDVTIYVIQQSTIDRVFWITASKQEHCYVSHLSTC